MNGLNVIFVAYVIEKINLIEKPLSKIWNPMPNANS